ncbi:MAG TPA: glycosyl hydrolase [bacterium]|nr:glycosyl hydrolase [bacterium]
MSRPSRSFRISRTFRFVLCAGLVAGFFSNAAGDVLTRPCPAETRADSVLRLLTLDEKIALLHGHSMFTSGGVPRLGIPELSMADGPTGVREELERDSWEPLNWTTDSSTYFPAGPALAATWNRDLAVRYGEALGEEARARGKDILLGPSVNIIRTPLSGRNFEFLTEDPYLNAEIAAGYIRGLQSRDVAACIKHYAVNNQEAMRNRIDVRMSERALREIYLPVYRAAVEKAGVLAVMAAYNRFRGAYCSENEYLLNTLLKDTWGFRGVVISDWGGTHSTTPAALNGLDIEMGSRGPYDRYYFAGPLRDSVLTGSVPERVIDEKARRVLFVMFSLKTAESANRHRGSLATEEQFKTACDVAAEAVVLLKNTGNFLPLDARKIRSLAVFGENATHRHAREGFGAGVKTRREITPLEGLERKLRGRAEIRFAQGYAEKYNLVETGRRWRMRIPDSRPDSLLIQEAVEIARTSDAAVIFGGANRTIESEAYDRPDMRLPFGQEALIRAVAAVNPNTVVVLIAGAPYDLAGIDSCVNALVWGWFNGSESGTAMADVLFGDVNPSGKLPFTIPVRLEDSPAHALGAYPGEDFTVEYKEDLLVGYRWFDTKRIDPLYAFGHGLSYSAFTYDTPWTDRGTYGAGDTVRVFCSVRNVSRFEGAEAVQLYMRHRDAPVPRPVQELKGFEKVFLRPWEEKEVCIRVPVRDLAFFDDREMEWAVPAGVYELLIGASSRDIRGKTLIHVE